MIGDGDVERAGVFQGGAHQVARDDGLPVVRNRHRAGAHHLAELRELLPLLADGDRADGIDPREPGKRRLAHDEPYGRLVVRDRIGVGHGAHGREAAGGRRPGAARDGFDVLVAGLPQVHVDVDQTGGHDPAPHVPHVRLVGRAEPHADGGDATVLDQHVRGLIEVAARVDYATAP